MAVQSLTSEFLSLGGTDVSAHIKSAVLSLDAAELDTTDMASGGWSEAIAGRRAGTLAIEFQDDVAASSIDSIIWGLIFTVTTFEVRLNSAVVGTSNPKYTGSVLVNSTAIGGGVTELATKSLTWPTSGTVARATA